jgi:medium-chain acyl-[acyl-carrier-protein] hydrolase
VPLETQQSPWIERAQFNPLAPARLFCFPYVGGGSSIYRDWVDDRDAQLDIVPLELPGRDKRLWEEPYSRLPPLVEALADALPQDKPFAFFGHSMGALVAFELARELERRGLGLPSSLFVSGSSAPQIPLRTSPRHLLSDTELLAELHNLGGTSEEILQDSEMMGLFLPTIRADFAVVETYQYVQSNTLHCPMVVFHGDQDHESTREDALAWRLQTSSTFRLHTFRGGHFFLHSAKGPMLSLIKKAVSSNLGHVLL